MGPVTLLLWYIGGEEDVMACKTPRKPLKPSPKKKS
jgi:hypothetical protein